MAAVSFLIFDLLIWKHMIEKHKYLLKFQFSIYFSNYFLLHSRLIYSINLKSLKSGDSENTLVRKTLFPIHGTNEWNDLLPVTGFASLNLLFSFRFSSRWSLTVVKSHTMLGIVFTMNSYNFFALSIWFMESR
jgi:hypothetical protein